MLCCCICVTINLQFSRFRATNESRFPLCEKQPNSPASDSYKYLCRVLKTYRRPLTPHSRSLQSPRAICSKKHGCTTHIAWLIGAYFSSHRISLCKFRTWPDADFRFTVGVNFLMYKISLFKISLGNVYKLLILHSLVTFYPTEVSKTVNGGTRKTSAFRFAKYWEIDSTEWMFCSLA